MTVEGWRAMAILVNFSKTGEDAHSVSYQCGFSGDPARFPLVIGRADLAPLVGDPQTEKAVWCSYVKIVRRVKDTGDWPEQGSYCA